MSVFFIRKPSETPNIQNIDDIRMVRYAYGNQNGYIKGYGAELSHNATGSTFLINSGIFVIQGAEVKIDANGWSESVSGVTNKRYYIIYGEVNLALQTAEIKSTYNHAVYPTIEAGDDLTQSTDGTARVLLYRFTATNSIIADVQKVIKAIPYSIELINGIEERLTSLGFRQDNIVDVGGGIIGTVKRQGNYVICQGSVPPLVLLQNESEFNATIPVGFRPAKQEDIGVSGSFIVYAGYLTYNIQGDIYGVAYPNGELKIYVNNAVGSGSFAQYTEASFYGGYEAAPIE